MKLNVLASVKRVGERGQTTFLVDRAAAADLLPQLQATRRTPPSLWPRLEHRGRQAKPNHPDSDAAEKYEACENCRVEGRHCYLT